MTTYTTLRFTPVRADQLQQGDTFFLAWGLRMADCCRSVDGTLRVLELTRPVELNLHGPVAESLFFPDHNDLPVQRCGWYRAGCPEGYVNLRIDGRDQLGPQIYRVLTP